MRGTTSSPSSFCAKFLLLLRERESVIFRFLAYPLMLLVFLLSLLGIQQTAAQTDPAPAVLPPPLSALELPPPPPTDPVITFPLSPTPTPSTPNVALSPDSLALSADASATVHAEISPPLTATPHWFDLAYWFGPTPWDLGFELGINGAQGNNEAFSFRTGGHIKRETEFWKIDNTLVYNKNSNNGLETQNNALLDVRLDRKLGDSPWSLYFLNQELYDEFQAYDLRVSANSGLGYQFVDLEHLDLLGRFGAGASREFGGPEDDTAYEVLFGMEYDHELTKTQRLSAKIDYFPEWEDFNRYRVVTDVGWEIDLDQPGNMSLKFSILDRYDSTPNGVDPNEVNYSVLLIWGI